MSALPPTVTLSQLAYFVAVAEELHFGRAAKRLHIEQSPLSQAIRGLEANLGVTLLHRTSRHVSLTDAGAELLPAARAALEAVNHAVSVARDAAAAEAGVIRVGFVAYGACDVIDRALARFAAEHDQLLVQTRQTDFSDPTGGLAGESVDVAFVRLPIGASTIESVTLLREPRVAVLPASHPLAGRDRTAISDLLNEHWLQMPATDPVWRDFWLAAPERGDLPTLLGPEVRTVDEQITATTTGGYVSLIPQSVTTFYPRQGIAYIPVEDIPPSEVAIAWRRGDDRPTTRTFVDAARATATTQADTPLTSTA
ncbi:MAG: LysR family transcriptional regulator [Solirubrobacteraceae bacterium]